MDGFDPANCGLLSRGANAQCIIQANSDSAARSLRVIGSLEKKKELLNYFIE